MKKTEFSSLRAKAEKIYKQCSQNNAIPSKDISQLLDELSIYQIELEIQNEDLIKVQMNLEESRSKYVELYDLAPVGYFAINKDGLIKEVNQAGCNLLGLEKHALINRCFSRYISPAFKMLFSEYKKRAFKEMAPLAYELKLLKWNQASFYAFIECKVVEGSSTRYPQLLAFITDISARKLSENLLHQQRIKMASIDRLRSLNEFIYGIAHEQYHSLTLINNYLHGCIRRLETGDYQIDGLLKILRNAVAQSQMLEEIIRSRKVFTSKTIFRYENVDINSIINQTILLLTHEMLEFPITIQYEATANLSQINLDKLHIQQTILNLARNAMEAMRDSNVEEPKLLIETTQINPHMIEVTFFDNGPGLNHELIPKLFEPHYTTKCYGVGLGLTMSRAIIEKHGGQLFAEANPSGGACFRLTLPCVVASQTL